MDEQEFDKREDENDMTGGEPGAVPPETGPAAVPDGSGTDRSAGRSTRAGIITGVILAVIAAAAIIVLADPFNLHLLDRLTGRYDAAMEAMPPDTTFYFGFDLRNFSPEKLDRVIKPFSARAEEAEVEDYAEILAQIDESLERDLGITLTDDVMPWVGQYVGIGLLNLDMGGFDLFGYSPVEPDISFLVAVEARDGAKADAFLELIGDKWTENNDLKSETTDYRGATITYWHSDDPGERLAYTRYKSVVLVSQDADDVERAIDAFTGESLADSPDFKSLQGDLHKGRGLTVFTSGQMMKGVYEDMPGFEFAASQFDIIRGYAMTLSIVDSGVQLDIISTIDEEMYTERFEQPYPTLMVQPGSPDLVPADSVIFLGGFPMENFWENYQKSLDAMGTGGDVAEAVDLLSGEIGLDLNEFFEALDGVFTLAVLPKEFGADSDPFSAVLPFDLLLMVGTSQQAEVLAMLEPLAAALEDTVMTELAPEKRGDFTIYDVYDPYMDASVFLFGIGKDHLVLTTSADVLDEAFGGGPSLATSERYQQASEALPGNMTPFMYFDVPGMVGMINDVENYIGTMQETEELSQPLDALVSVSMGADVQPGPTVFISVLAIIEQP
jgi:hypothetical protein